MIRRETQDPAYWNEEFSITSEDLQYLSTLLVGDELPRSTEELSRALILHRGRQEEAVIERALSKGTPYQPKRSFEIGEWVVFPALEYRAGEVVGVRPGHNPEYDAFTVIEVALEEGGKREFAAEFDADHALNREGSGAAESGELLSPEQLAQQYAPKIEARLEERLESEPDFVQLAGRWFREDLLVDVHEGHLNLAEAVLDVAAGGPLPTDALLGDVELPEEISPQLRVFSLNYTLQADGRFDEVGPAGEVLWFLRRLEPDAVKATPRFLRYEPLEGEPPLLTSEMNALVRELDDEWSDVEQPAGTPGPVELVLTYPHWRAGTLPISSRLEPVFPSGHTDRIRFTIVDGDTGQEMAGWVVQKGRYVYGLEDWYQENQIPVGAYLEVSRGEQPGTVVIRPRNRRSRREWVRVATPVDGRLTFGMHRVEIACEYDELMVMATASRAEMDRVWDRTQEEGLLLGQLVDEIFPELAGLSPQGNVHAATLYSAVNAAIRTPPGPVLEALVESERYAPVGDNYWVVHSGARGV